MINSLRELLTSEEGFGLTTATELQKEICDLIQGLPISNPSKRLRQALGASQIVDENTVIGEYEGEIPTAPDEIIILAGIRGGKSLMATAASVWFARHIDQKDVTTDGDPPRVSALSISLDNAKVLSDKLTGALGSSPVLKKWVKKFPSGTAYEVEGIEPGTKSTINIVAGKRAGGSLVSRYMAAVVFDEVTRMVGAQDGVVNYDDSMHAIVGRMMDGACILAIGSPWAPVGPIYKKFQEFYGKPSKDLVILRCPGHWLNPVWWTPERIEKVKRKDPVAYRTDILAQFADSSYSFFPAKSVQKSTIFSDTIPKQDKKFYVAAMDPATRGNAWTFTVFSKSGQGDEAIFEQVHLDEWQGDGNDPLKPSEVLQQIKVICDDYDLDWVYTDQFSSDALMEIADMLGLQLVIDPWTAQNKVSRFESVRIRFLEDKIRLIKNTNQESDLLHVRKNLTATGIQIAMPETSDGRHCDFAPVLVRAISHWIEDEEYAGEPEYGTPEWNEWYEKQLDLMEDQEEDEYADLCYGAIAHDYEEMEW